VPEDHERNHAERVAGILCPPPATVRIGRWPLWHWRPDEEEWLVLESRREPRWLLPARCRECGKALLRHDQGQRNPRALKVLSFLQGTGVLRWAPISRVRVRGRDMHTGVEAMLGDIVGDRVTMCVRLGRRRMRRSLLLQLVNADGRTVAFAKLATTDEAVRALRTETANLERVAQIIPEALVLSPKVLHTGNWQGHELLIMSPLLPRRTTRPGDGIPVERMLKMARVVPRPAEQVAGAAFTRRQSACIEALRVGPDATVLRRAQQYLLTTFGDVVLEVGLWHGDWVPWNMAATDHGIQLWDWEHFSERVPVGWDLVHYLSQRLRISSGMKRKLEGRWLSQAFHNVSHHMGLGRREILALVMSYLIEINIRYLADRTYERANIPPRVLGGLALLEEIVDGRVPWDTVTMSPLVAEPRHDCRRSGISAVPVTGPATAKLYRSSPGWRPRRAGD
jgi:hypothetical protein